MYQNKIEKFTDRLFFKSKTIRSPTPRLSLNFKSLSSITKNKYQILKSQCTPPSQLGYNISKTTHNQHDKFRESKQEMGLNKTDIDKLELMFMDLRAQDYLAKLIQIHQQEKALKDENDLYLINNQQNKQECQSQCDKRSEQFELFGEKKEPAKKSDKFKLLITQCNQKMQQNNQKREAKVKYNISKKKIKLQNLRHKKDVKSLNKNNKDKEKQENTSKKNKQSLSVTKQPKQRQKKNKISQKIEQRNKKKQQLKLKVNSRNSNDTQKSNANNNNKTVYLQSKSFLTPSIQSSNDFQKQFKLRSAKDDLDQIEQRQDNGNQQYIKNSSQQVYYEQRQVSNSKILEEMCYAQIGKRMVTVTEKQMPQQFFKVSLHIRSYIMKSIVTYIQYLAQFSPNSIFILPNERGLHYQPNQKPPILCNYLQHTRYIQIIKTINHIIQKNIFKQKYKQSQTSYWPYVLIVMFLFLLIMMLLIIFVNPNTNQNTSQVKNQNNVNQLLMVCSGFVICVIMVVLVGYSFYCYGKNMEFVPACEIIQYEISAYFRFVNGKMENDLQWIIGESFFWVQVKIRTKKDKQNQLTRMKNKKQKSFQYFQRNKNKENIQDLYKNQKDKIIQYE